jgi:hypothetical protein
MNSTANFEVALKSSVLFPGSSDPSFRLAENFVLFIQVPNAVLTGSETIDVVDKSSLFVGTTGLQKQDPFTIGDNTYFPFVLELGQGLDLSQLGSNVWRYAFTFRVSPAPSTTNRFQFKVTDYNTTEIRDSDGNPIYSVLLYNDVNQLTSASASLLPSSMLEFNVSKQGTSGALVSWSTANESNVKHYVVERSFSGNGGWESISQVAAKGFSATTTTYSYTDANINFGSAASKVVYYRIRAVDMDANEKFSAIRSLQFVAGNGKTVTVYPNPAKDGFYVSVPTLNPMDKKIRLNLLSQTGQIMVAREINANIASNYYFDINAKGIRSGDYMLQVIMDGQIIDTKKIIVQR